MQVKSVQYMSPYIKYLPKGVGWGAQSRGLIKPALGHSHSWLIVIHDLLKHFPSKSVSYPYVYGRRFEDMK